MPNPRRVSPEEWLAEVRVRGAATRARDAILKKSPEMARSPSVLRAALEGDELMSASRLAREAGQQSSADFLAREASKKFRSLERLAGFRGGARVAGGVLRSAASLGWAEIPFIAMDAWEMSTQIREEGPAATGRQIAEGAEQIGRALGRAALNRPAEEFLGLREPGGEIRPGTLRGNREREEFIERQTQEFMQTLGWPEERARQQAGRMFARIDHSGQPLSREEKEEVVMPGREGEGMSLEERERRRAYHKLYLAYRDAGASDSLASQRATEDVYGFSRSRRTYGESMEELGRMSGLEREAELEDPLGPGSLVSRQAESDVWHGPFGSFMRSVGLAPDELPSLPPGVRLVERSIERRELGMGTGLTDLGPSGVGRIERREIASMPRERLERSDLPSMRPMRERASVEGREVSGRRPQMTYGEWEASLGEDAPALSGDVLSEEELLRRGMSGRYRSE